MAVRAKCFATPAERPANRAPFLNPEIIGADRGTRERRETKKVEKNLNNNRKKWGTLAKHMIFEVPRSRRIFPAIIFQI